MQAMQVWADKSVSCGEWRLESVDRTRQTPPAGIVPRELSTLVIIHLVQNSIQRAAIQHSYIHIEQNVTHMYIHYAYNNYNTGI